MSAISKFKRVYIVVKVNLDRARRIVLIFIVNKADYDLILRRVSKQKARFTKTNNNNGTYNI